MSVPSGFAPYHRPSRFVDVIGPVPTSARCGDRVTLVASGVFAAGRPPDRR
jgi:hypothetical protein